MKKGFKTEILLTETQKQKVNQTIGVCRYVYNLYLSKNQEVYKKEKIFMSGEDFSKWLNNVHTKEHDRWIKDVSSKAVKKSIMNADHAFHRFFKGLSKFPTFKKKKNQDVKAYFIKSSGFLEVNRHRIKIPTLGWVRVKEFGYIPSRYAKSATVSRKAGRYFVSVLCEVKQKEKKSVSPSEGIGIDLGVKDFAICSNGTVYKNINKTLKVRKLEKKLKREQRSLSRKYENLRKRGETSAVKKRANIGKNMIRVQKVHARLATIRLEYVKFVVNQLVKTKPMFITIEDLNVKGMVKNRHLSRAIAHQCFYTFKKWLINKCKEHRIELRQVGRFYPSSKICSCCGQKKADLNLSDRVYRCECGHEMDRDRNASMNLLQAKKYTILTS